MDESEGRPPASDRIRRPVATVTGLVARLLRGAVAGLLAALVLLSAAETAAWTLVGLSWPALAEIQGLLLVWLTFLTAAWGVESGLHLGVELVVGRLPEPARRGAELAAALATALFGGLCAVYGARLAATVVNTLPATGWSAAAQYLPAAVGGALIAGFALVGAGARPPGGGTEGAQ